MTQQQQIESNIASDEVKLHIGRQTFTCSKSNLCERSEYFRAMFSHEFSEKAKNEIVLQSVDETAFNFIFEKKTLDYSVEFDLVIEILKVASMLQFDKETEECEKYILMSNCFSYKPLQVMVISSLLNRIKLYKKSFAYCLWNFNQLTHTEDFLNLPFQDLMNYINDSHLHINEELEVFDAIKQWIYHNNPDDARIIALIKTLRFKALFVSDLEEMKTTHLVSKQNYLNILISGWLDYEHKNRSYGCVECISQKTDKKENRCICSINDGLYYSLKELENKELRVQPTPCIVIHKTDTFPTIYDFSGDVLKKLLILSQKPFSKTFVGFRMISVDFKIYIFGGEQGFGYGKFNTGVWSYNLISETCNYECQMLQQRRHFFITVIDEWVFVLGGTGKHRKVLDNIEKYNMKTRQWFDCTGLNQKVIDAVCSYNKKIYIAASGTIITYDPYEHILDTIDIVLPVYGVSFITVFKDFLYAIDRKDSNIFRWTLISKPKGSDYNDTRSTFVYSMSTYLGKFHQHGESIALNDRIYHLSCNESDASILVEKFCFYTKCISRKRLKNSIGEFQPKHIGCFQLPSYF